MKLITQNFKTHAARQFLESFSESANTIYYVSAHKSIPFTDDGAPPSPENTPNYTQYGLYADMLFGKHVTPNDVKHMIRHNVWTTNTVYDMYDDAVENLQDKNFFVSSLESETYHIFKCLYNNGGKASTDQPLFSEIDVADELYRTTDSYQWKYMYSITPAEYAQFATADYIPVIENAEVTAAAVNGSIDSIIITNPGAQYNSYASGNFKEAAVNGNTLLHSLSGEKFTDYLITVPDITGFVEEKVTSLNVNGKTATGIIVYRDVDNNTMRVTAVNGKFVAGRTIDGVSSNTNATITTAVKLTAELSPDTDFYKNNSLYIREGVGAGQLRTITEYIVSGDERRVLLDSPLDVLPTTSSLFEIGPRVIISGDGQSAGAVATVDPSANGIIDIEIVNSGTNYTYADIQIFANTGNVDAATNLPINTTSAQARAIISPPGGHGSNVINELYASKVGIGIQFVNTESGEISAENDFRTISILKDPLFANVAITLESSTSSSYTAGETVVQATTDATGIVTNRDADTLTLSSVRGFFTSGNDITGLISGYTAGAIAIDRSCETFDQRQVYQVEVTSTGINGTGFLEDELVIQSGLSTLTSSDIVRLSIDNSAYLNADGEVITQANTGATGVISSRYNNIVVVTDTTGTFLSGTSELNFITGGLGNVVSVVSEVDNTFQANAFGYIHSVNVTSDVIGLTGVRGFFSISDDISGTINTFEGQTSGAIAKITGRAYDKNYIVDNSGEFLYTENFIPIERNVSQTEKVKLVIEF